MEPSAFNFTLAEFDLSLLPVDAGLLRSDEAMLRSTLERHLREMFERLSGESRIIRHKNKISVLWFPKSPQDKDSLMAMVVGLIARQAYGPAETILTALLSRHPDDRRALFNLGVLLCEQGRLQDARRVLKKLTSTAPDAADGWNALGVALSREGKRKEAQAAFERSLALDPENGHTLRNLGALMARRTPHEALPYLKRAVKLLVSDQAAQYTYGKCLADAGRLAEADRILKRAVAINERSDLADLCREARIEIRRRSLVRKVPRGVKTDKVLFCLTAIETFRELGRERTRAIVFELASLASRGLDIRDRTSRIRLVSLPGEFSALQLVVYLYVGLKKTSPRTDPGIDFSKEYALALSIRAGKRRMSKTAKSGSRARSRRARAFA
jgi:Tfp pilus assembly protein PilF